jgi:NADH:ubiquinone oxidoreductase subunit F (NADH-binding)
MRRTLSRLFADHPREVGESYFEHMGAAAGFGFKLARLSGAAFVHAVVPGLHKTTVSDAIREMAGEMGGRAQEARETRMREAGAIDPGL